MLSPSTVVKEKINAIELDSLFKKIFSEKIEPLKLFQFFSNYLYFNNAFGPATLNLIQKSNSYVGFLRDKNELVDYTQNRINEIMAYIFSAQKDEYSYKDLPITHKLLAEATFKGFINYLNLSDSQVKTLAVILPDTKKIAKKIYLSLSLNKKNLERSYFRAIGYNLAQEVSADREYYYLSNFIKNFYPEFYEYLSEQKYKFRGAEYTALTWITIHTTVEINHAKEAMSAVDLIFKYYDGEQSKKTLLSWMDEGINDFKETIVNFLLLSNQKINFF
jgi:hypothetical protein